MKKRGKNKFIRQPKHAMASLPNKLICGGIRGAGAVAANIGSNHLQKLVPSVPAKLHGPGLFLLGVLGEAFVNNDYARSAAEGVTTAGALKMADEFTPQVVKDTIGMSGLGSVVIDSTPNWDNLITQSAQGAPIELEGLGLDDDSFDFESYEDPERISKQMKGASLL